MIDKLCESNLIVLLKSLSHQNQKDQLQFSPEKGLLQKDGFHLFSCCHSTISHEMMDNFME